MSSTATGISVHAVTEDGVQFFDEEPDPPDPVFADDPALAIDLPEIPTEAGIVAWSSLSVAEQKDDLRTRNADVAKRLVDLTGWNHARVQGEMNRLAGVGSVAHAPRSTSSNAASATARAGSAASAAADPPRRTPARRRAALWQHRRARARSTGGRVANARVALISRVARAPELRRVNLAFLGYSIGEHATWLAIAVYALERGGATEVGVAAAAQLLPGVLLTPFSSYAGDRFRPQRALAAGYAVQCLGMVATALSMVADRGALTYVLGAVVATAISFTRPVMGSLMPTVTHAPADLVAANVVAGIIEQVGVFVGPVLGGVLLAVASPATVFATSAALTGAGALAVGTIRHAVDDRVVVPSGRDAVAQMVAGFAAVRQSTMLQLLLVFVAGAGLVRGVGDVVFVTFADERLDAGGGRPASSPWSTAWAGSSPLPASPVSPTPPASAGSSSWPASAPVCRWPRCRSQRATGRPAWRSHCSGRAMRCW